MSDNLAVVVIFFAVFGGWVCGIAAAVVKGGFWLIAGSILLPPVAWVVLAMRLFE